jgi:hypothetical protein
MFHGAYDRAARAGRYRAVAAEYNRLFKTASDPYLASYYLRIAKDYLVRSQDELRFGARDFRRGGLYRRRAKPPASPLRRLAQDRTSESCNARASTFART